MRVLAGTMPLLVGRRWRHCRTRVIGVIRAGIDYRVVLARALALGCHTLRLTPDRPVVAEGDDLTLVAAQLDPALAVPPTTDELAPSTSGSAGIPTPVTPGRRTTMKPESNGHTPPRGDPPDPLDLAEGLRDALADAAAKAARLVAVLRQNRKEKKALASVLSSLQQLNLGAGDVR